MTVILHFKKKKKKKEMCIPFKPTPKERHSSALTFLLAEQPAEAVRPNFLIHGRQLRHIYIARKVLSNQQRATALRDLTAASAESYDALCPCIPGQH